MVTFKKIALPVKTATSRVICQFCSKSFSASRFLTQHLNMNLMCQSRNMALQGNQIGALRQPLPSSTSTTSSSRIVPPQISNFPSLHHEISQNASSSSSSLIAAVNHNSTSHDISASDMEEENDNQSQSETIAPPSFANINLPQSSNLRIYSSISSATNNANLPKKSAGLYPINRSIFLMKSQRRHHLKTTQILILILNPNHLQIHLLNMRGMVIIKILMMRNI
jgi:hypothetical protein